MFVLAFGLIIALTVFAWWFVFMFGLWIVFVCLVLCCLFFDVWLLAWFVAFVLRLSLFVDLLGLGCCC